MSNLSRLRTVKAHHERFNGAPTRILSAAIFVNRDFIYVLSLLWPKHRRILQSIRSSKSPGSGKSCSYKCIQCGLERSPGRDHPVSPNQESASQCSSSKDCKIICCVVATLPDGVPTPHQESGLPLSRPHSGHGERSFAGPLNCKINEWHVRNTSRYSRP